jgi:hypothetical protein
VIVVLQRHRSIAAHSHEDRHQLGIAKQRRAFGFNGMRMAGDFAVRQHYAAILAVDRIELFWDRFDWDN